LVVGVGLANHAGMTKAQWKQLGRDLLVGLVVGIVVLSGLSYGIGQVGGRSAPSAQKS
jgi:hypothetical protein